MYLTSNMTTSSFMTCCPGHSWDSGLCLLCHSMLHICCRSFTGRLSAMSTVCVVFLWQLLGDKDVWYIIVCYVYVNSMFVSGGGG